MNALLGSFLECGVVQISMYMDSVEFIALKNDGKWAAVAHGYLHVGAEDTGFYDWDLFPALLDDVFVQLFCQGWISCLSKRWPVSFDAVCIEGELGYEEQGAIYIF